MPISSIIGATYASGFGFYPNAAMFFTFMHERHPELLWPYFHILYSDQPKPPVYTSVYSEVYITSDSNESCTIMPYLRRQNTITRSSITKR